MNEEDKKLYAGVKAIYETGYRRAQEFLQDEQISLIELLRVLTSPGRDKASEIITDAGAIAWCMEQIKDET